MTDFGCPRCLTHLTWSQPWLSVRTGVKFDLGERVSGYWGWQAKCSKSFDLISRQHGDR